MERSPRYWEARRPNGLKGLVLVAPAPRVPIAAPKEQREAMLESYQSPAGVEFALHFAKAEGLELIREFVEVGTGKGSDALDRRPQLKAALAAAKKLRCHVAVAKPSNGCSRQHRRQDCCKAPHRAHSGNPAFRRPSISNFAFDCQPRSIHADIVNAGSTSSIRAAASRASPSRPRWAKADARQR